MNLVHHILEDARRRLVVLGRDASACAAAGFLANPRTPLVVICDGAGAAVGVISRSNLIQLFARPDTDARSVAAGSIMTTPVLSCHVDHTLQRVWEALNERSFRCVPILDSEGRPLGIVHAHDLARALLDEVIHEEELLRDYVLGIGYQ